jgi:transcriptional regulator GlxA family with amidase domain
MPGVERRERASARRPCHLFDDRAILCHMQRVLIVAFEGAVALDIFGPAEVFSAASPPAGAPAYRVEVVTPGGGETGTSTSVPIVTRDVFGVRARPGDTILVAGGEEAAIVAAMADQELLAWLRRAARVARRVASVCSGAFVLAAAGLLDGRRATTHWRGCARLAHLFPRVSVDANAIFVADGSVWTSAGVTTGIDMALAMVEKDHGRKLADSIAAGLVLYARRPGFQSQFSEALVSQLEDSSPLGAAVAWIRNHLGEASVDRLARASALSVRTLHRRCHEHLSLTPAKLIEKVRVEQARTLLVTTRASAKAVAAQCGFGTATNMKRAFERELGVAPAEYRLLHARDETPRRRAG